jgi:hypothetical protein
VCGDEGSGFHQGKSGFLMDITYDETYTSDIAGIDFNSSGHSSLQILSWQQN